MHLPFHHQEDVTIFHVGLAVSIMNTNDNATRIVIKYDSAGRRLAYAFALLGFVIQATLVHSLASSSPSENPASFTLFDRFQPICPADLASVRRFDPTLVDDDDDANCVWVAVFRSSNNKPSVMIKDDFLLAMRAAVDTATVSAPTSTDVKVRNSFETSDASVLAKTPVAVARLRPSPDFETCWVLDSMRCVLKKENTDQACDGGSEHTEALSSGIDALLRFYLQTEKQFEKAIRTKATLVSGILLEERGFRPVESLQKDMATHVSSIDRCMENYASRSVSDIGKSPGARQRALEIVSLLAQVDRDADLKNPAHANENDALGGGEDFDPWSSVKRYL